MIVDATEQKIVRATDSLHNFYIIYIYIYIILCIILCISGQTISYLKIQFGHEKSPDWSVCNINPTLVHNSARGNPAVQVRYIGNSAKNEL